MMPLSIGGHEANLNVKALMGVGKEKLNCACWWQWNYHRLILLILAEVIMWLDFNLAVSGGNQDRPPLNISSSAIKDDPP